MSGNELSCLEFTRQPTKRVEYISQINNLSITFEIQFHHFRLVATSTEAQRPLGEFVTSQEIRTSNA